MQNRRTFLAHGLTISGAALLSTNANADQTQTVQSGIPGYDYRKPAFENGSRLVFIGDSITDMKWGRNETDRNHYLGHSYVFLIASRLLMDLPNTELQFFNRGHSGNTLEDLKNRWHRDAIEMKPDVLSILVGTNDCGKAGKAGVDLDKWESTYRKLLDSSRDSNPNLQIVLLDPFALKVGKLTAPETWNIRGVGVTKLAPIVEKIAADYDAVHIRTQEIFDRAAGTSKAAHWIWDGIHPLPQGHELIARHWLHEVSARWPQR